MRYVCIFWLLLPTLSGRCLYYSVCGSVCVCNVYSRLRTHQYWNKHGKFANARQPRRGVYKWSESYAFHIVCRAHCVCVWTTEQLRKSSQNSETNMQFVVKYMKLCTKNSAENIHSMRKSENVISLFACYVECEREQAKREDAPPRACTWILANVGSVCLWNECSAQIVKWDRINISWCFFFTTDIYIHFYTAHHLYRSIVCCGRAYYFAHFRLSVRVES